MSDLRIATERGGPRGRPPGEVSVDLSIIQNTYASLVAAVLKQAVETEPTWFLTPNGQRWADIVNLDAKMLYRLCPFDEELD